MKTKIETLSTGHRLVRRYRNGRCYACVWSPDSTDEQITQDMSNGAASFYAWNETPGQFWPGATSNARPSHFKS